MAAASRPRYVRANRTIRRSEATSESAGRGESGSGESAMDPKIVPGRPEIPVRYNRTRTWSPRSLTRWPSTSLVPDPIRETPRSHVVASLSWAVTPLEGRAVSST